MPSSLGGGSMPTNVLHTYTLDDICSSAEKMGRFLTRFLRAYPSNYWDNSLDMQTYYRREVREITYANYQDRYSVLIRIEEHLVALYNALSSHFHIDTDSYLKGKLQIAVGNFIAGVNINSSNNVTLTRITGGTSVYLPYPLTVRYYHRGTYTVQSLNFWGNSGLIQWSFVSLDEDNGQYTYNIERNNYIGLGTISSTYSSPRPTTARPPRTYSGGLNRDTIRGYETDVQSVIPGVRDYIRKIENTNKFIIGMELEVEARDYDIADHITGTYGDYCILKRDGSLDEELGFEIVTRPDTPKAHRKYFGELLESSRGSIVSYNGYNCGLHVHVNIGFFDLDSGSDGKYIPSSPVALGKLVAFMYNPDNYNFLKKIAQRSWLENSYCVRPQAVTDIMQVFKKHQKFGFDYTTEEYFNKIMVEFNQSEFVPHRKVALNITHRGTLEFRLFKGTCNKVSFFSKIDFVEAVCYWVKSKSASITDLSVSAFLQWLDGEAEYNYLKTFIKKYRVPGYELIVSKFKDMDREADESDVAPLIEEQEDDAANSVGYFPSATDIPNNRLEGVAAGRVEMREQISLPLHSIMLLPSSIQLEIVQDMATTYDTETNAYHLSAELYRRFNNEILGVL